MKETTKLRISPKEKSSAKRPLVFLGVGIINTLLDFGFYTLLTQTIFQDKDHITLAGIVSGTFALICAFLTHSFITWRGSDIGRKTFLMFFLVTGFGMWVIRPLLLGIFIQFGWIYSWSYKISESLGLPFSENFISNTGAFGFMVIILLIYNYFAYDRFVFTSKTPDHTDPGNR